MRCKLLRVKLNVDLCITMTPRFLMVVFNFYTSDREVKMTDVRGSGGDDFFDNRLLKLGAGENVHGEAGNQICSAWKVM